ncbi:MAG: primosomal protein N' [Nitrosomonas sp.]|nr:primosomal protein N' [Nitrosomonas sp.]
MVIIRVALNAPVDCLFDYVAPEASQQDIGLRVRVSFGRKLMTGIIMDVSSKTPVSREKLKSVEYIYREIPPLSTQLLDLFRFCSNYYHYPLGMIVMNGLPSRLRNPKVIQPKKANKNFFYGLTESGKQVNISSISTRHTSQRRLLAQLRESGIISVKEAKQISPHAIKILKVFIAKGWIEETPVLSTIITETPSIPPLTAEQEIAVNAITAEINRFNTWLLHGVTGSGKTEVYLQLISRVLSQGLQALVMIPEINLTPQLETIFQARFPAAPLVSLHSGLNDTERVTGWLQAQRGEAKIILGTRSAIFTPLPNLGLVIVDEEQDSSFKQQEGLRYSARDIAIFRARQANVPVILGSATPSLESYYNATTQRYRNLRLLSRAIKNATMPSINCIDTRIAKTCEGFSQPLIKALGNCLNQKQQSLVFINRRGYAPVLLCKSCSWTADCHRCASRLVVHLREKKLRCHHCGHQESFPCACPKCGDQDIAPFGQGTQRVEATLAAHFPDARIMRIDRDSIRRKDAWQTILKTIHQQEVDILIGTQLLAKGHDFPNLSLVGILNSDVSLYSTDFRASERLFIQLMQVAGRAGRAGIAGNVLIQTEFPDHPLYHALKQHDYDSLAQTLLIERKTAGFPPFVYQALLRAQAHCIDTALDFLSYAVSVAGTSENLELFDPVPAQMSRLKGLERAHVLIQSRSRKRLHTFLVEWHKKLKAFSSRKIRWSLDIDPLEF